MAEGTNVLLTKRRGEGKIGRIQVADFDAYFGESALMISIMPKI